MIKEKQIQSLKEKGWSDTEIKHAAKILHREVNHDKHFSKIIFYSAFLLTIFVNIIISFGLMFLSIVFSPLVLYGLVSLFGVGIGFLYNFLIKDIGHLETKHHNLALIVVPFMALFNMVIVVIVANKFIEDLNIPNIQHNPYMVGVVFGLFMLSPLVFERWFKR